MQTRITSSLVLCSLTVMTACGGGGGGGGSSNPATAPLGNVVAYTGDNAIVTFNVGAPDAIISSQAIAGLQPGEKLTGIDYRPATGELIGLGTTSRLYRIDPTSGAATAISVDSFTPAVRARVVGLDVDPVRDQVRIVTESDRNIRVDPSTGFFVNGDTFLAFAASDPNFGTDPNVVGLAYTGPFAGASSTTLYAIDLVTNSLVRVGDEGGAPVDAASGELHTIGSLGIPATGLVGFDIAAAGGALLTTSDALASRSRLYRVDLATGAATELGEIGVTLPIRGLAIRPPVASRVFGLTTNNALVTFRPGRPDQLLSSRVITGLATDESVVAIDMRVADGRLYGLGASGRVYRIDAATAAATALGLPALTLAGDAFGFDCDPVADVLRITTDLQRNVRVSAETGEIVGEDTPLAYSFGDPNFGSAPSVAAIAYTDNRFASTETTLYGLDVARDALVRVGSVGGAPSSGASGELHTIGALGFDATALAGFDIDAVGVAFASLASGISGTTELRIVDLQSGDVRSLGSIGAGLLLRDIALELPPPAQIVGLNSLGRLVAFSAGTPSSITATKTITGLSGSESVVSIDFRTSTNQLYGVTSASRLVTIDVSSGLATPVGPAFAPTFTGTRIACEFDPLGGVLRVTSDIGENRSLDLTSGATANIDALLSYAAGDAHAGTTPTVVALAHDRSTIGSAATTLFGIDETNDTLVRIGSVDGAPNDPATGIVSTIGALDSDATSLCGLDVAQDGVVYAVLTASGSGQSGLYRIDPATGEASLLGIVGGATLRDAAVVPFGL